MKSKKSRRPLLEKLRTRFYRAGDWKELERRYSRYASIRYNKFFDTVMKLLPHDDMRTVYYVVNPDDGKHMFRITIANDNRLTGPTLSWSRNTTLECIESLVAGKKNETFMCVDTDVAKKVWCALRRNDRVNAVAGGYYSTLCDVFHAMYDQGSYAGLAILVENENRQYVIIYDRPYHFELCPIQKD